MPEAPIGRTSAGAGDDREHAVKAGSTFDVEVVDSDGHPIPLANLSVDVVLYSGGRPRYRFEAGTTDRRGHLHTSYEALELQRQHNQQQFAQLDYDTSLTECDDTIGLAVPTFDELGERLARVQEWFPEYASALEARVKKSGNREFGSADVKKVAANGSRIAVQLAVERN
jgi:hypothetical protein